MITLLYCVDKISTLFPNREVKLVIIGTYFMATFHFISTGKWYASAQFHVLMPLYNYNEPTNASKPNLRNKTKK